jgi:trimeric autotransporter adhesin
VSPPSRPARGNNQDGKLGTGDETESLVPTQVLGLTQGVTAIATGTSHACAVVNQAVQCWGMDDSGQIGNDSVGDQWLPVNVLLP